MRYVRIAWWRNRISPYLIQSMFNWIYFEIFSPLKESLRKCGLCFIIVSENCLLIKRLFLVESCWGYNYKQWQSINQSNYTSGGTFTYGNKEFVQLLCGLKNVPVSITLASKMYHPLFLHNFAIQRSELWHNPIHQCSKGREEYFLWRLMIEFHTRNEN